jgi:hypothetical protein
MSDDTSWTGHGPRRESAKEKLWRRVLADFAASGQSVRAFCRVRELSEPSFYAWRRSLARRDATRRSVTPHGPPTPAFLPIRLAETTGGTPMEIVLAGGHRICLRPPVDRAALTEVVAALESGRSAHEPEEA